MAAYYMSNAAYKQGWKCLFRAMLMLKHQSEIPENNEHIL